MTPEELADVRRILADPEEHPFFPRAIVEGLLAEVDALTSQIDQDPDDLDTYIREQLAADPAFRREFMRLHAVALLRAVRERHKRYRGASDETDYCEHCSRLTGYGVPYPCDTIKDVGGEDDIDALLPASSFGSPQALAIAAQCTYALLDGRRFNLRKLYADRDGVPWVCLGWFRALDSQLPDTPLMSTLNGTRRELTLEALVETRSPLIVIGDRSDFDGDPEIFDTMLSNARGAYASQEKTQEPE